ncbi:PREDICTED: uncharacterized protein LOC106811792 [Priapulus caudatus]|uniref:Uncharacterized protein LOC106811792 n=1 Tax=Priapulus caudatus TaxID=37621 RepID=A0ABM1EFM7_PRICU|nr:PREDICTED: uncharacterized protein LOC106811792 [Priapulus caudatus]
MINALWQSKPVTGRSRGFVTHLGGPVFGWEAIEDMWKRDKDRRARNVSREVPSLQESFIKRDAWTKLNVRPAKVMQQEQVLAELAHHALSADKPQPSNAATTIMTKDYLQACNLVFENGLLSHEMIDRNHPKTMDNIRKGYQFFEDWLETLLDEISQQREESFHLTSPKERRFLSWQTWDLLRVMYFGFTGLVSSFMERHPDHFISPLRINGSAVETLFSQFKARAGGKLSSLNYETSLRSYLTKRNLAVATKTIHHSARGYRDVELKISHAPMVRKSKK